jgi:hypothetical protein
MTYLLTCVLAAALVGGSSSDQVPHELVDALKLASRSITEIPIEVQTTEKRFASEGNLKSTRHSHHKLAIVGKADHKHLTADAGFLRRVARQDWMLDAEIMAVLMIPTAPGYTLHVTQSGAQAHIHFEGTDECGKQGGVNSVDDSHHEAVNWCGAGDFEFADGALVSTHFEGTREDIHRKLIVDVRFRKVRVPGTTSDSIVPETATWTTFDGSGRDQIVSLYKLKVENHD